MTTVLAPIGPGWLVDEAGVWHLMASFRLTPVRHWIYTYHGRMTMTSEMTAYSFLSTPSEAEVCPDCLAALRVAWADTHPDTHGPSNGAIPDVTTEGQT